MTRHTDQLITDSLKLSIRTETAKREKENVLRTALELLNRFVATEEIKIQEGRIESEAQVSDFIEAATFLNQNYGRKYSVKEAREILDRI